MRSHFSLLTDVHSRGRNGNRPHFRFNQVLNISALRLSVSSLVSPNIENGVSNLFCGRNRDQFIQYACNPLSYPYHLCLSEHRQAFVYQK